MEENIWFAPLSSDAKLSELLELPAPAFPYGHETFVQVGYLEDYIKRTDLIPDTERCIAIEEHYVDRDFMGDHSVFFSNMLKSTDNFCRRVHFFAGKKNSIEEEIFRISEMHAAGKTQKEIDAAADDFSERYYLGFTVIRPLPGCPVGRTVLKVLPATKEKDKSRRVLTCTRKYRVHLLGLTLNVRGLAFQQQDLGVSRCATIALWCALHKITESEPAGHATPAEITNLASRYRLPFGRPMPSEGLNAEQMCLALQSLGISPFQVKAGPFAQARSFIYAATQSSIPSVLIMRKVLDQNVWHAVTVVGMKINPDHQVCLVDPKKPIAGDDLSGDLKALYVQDDRIGPYRRAEVFPSDTGAFGLKIKIQSHVSDGKTEDWIVEQVLLPLHQKIRVGITELRKLARVHLIPEIQSVVAANAGLIDPNKVQELMKDPALVPPVRFSYWIERGHIYSRRVLREHLLGNTAARDFQRNCVLPRYVAVLRFGSDKYGQLDVLVDTTSPRPNYHWIAVLARDTGNGQSALLKEVAEYLAEKCRCNFYW